MAKDFDTRRRFLVFLSLKTQFTTWYHGLRQDRLLLWPSALIILLFYAKCRTWLTWGYCHNLPFLILNNQLNQRRKILQHAITLIKLLKPNDLYICRTAALTSRRYILNIYLTNILTEYFKHAAKSPFFFLQNAVYFIMLPCLFPVLFAFYLQDVLKFKCKIPAPKG